MSGNLPKRYTQLLKFQSTFCAWSDALVDLTVARISSNSRQFWQSKATQDAAREIQSRFPQRTECHVHNTSVTWTPTLSLIPMFWVALHWYLHPIPLKTLCTAYKRLGWTGNSLPCFDNNQIMWEADTLSLFCSCLSSKWKYPEVCLGEIYSVSYQQNLTNICLTIHKNIRWSNR